MSKMRTGIAMAALVFSSLACAQQGYVGIGAGNAETNVGGDSRETAYKLFGGYDFNRNWAIEAGWADLGKPRWPLGESRETAWYLAGKGTMPIGNQFDLFAKLGASWNKVAINDTRKSDLFVGVGAEYMFTKQVGLRLEYDDFGKFDDGNSGRHRATMWSISLDYKFPAKF